MNENEIVNVATTHLYFNPLFDYVKYLQIYLISRMVTAPLQNLFTYPRGKVCENINENEATVFCGDLNSFPNSIVLDTFLRKEPPAIEKCPVQYTAEEFRMYEETYKRFMELTPNLKWESVYANYKSLIDSNQEGHPDYTNYKPHFKETLDYIFYLKNSR